MNRFTNFGWENHAFGFLHIHGHQPLLANVETECIKSQFNLSAETVGETTSSSNRSRQQKEKDQRKYRHIYHLYKNEKGEGQVVLQSDLAPSIVTRWYRS